MRVLPVTLPSQALPQLGPRGAGLADLPLAHWILFTKQVWLQLAEFFRKAQGGGRLENRFLTPKLALSSFGCAPPRNATTNAFGALRIAHASSIAPAALSPRRAVRSRGQATNSMMIRELSPTLRPVTNRPNPIGRPKAEEFLLGFSL